MKFEIDFKALEKTKRKGWCLCEFRKNNDGSNVCPCDTFIKNHQCKCHVFRRVE